MVQSDSDWAGCKRTRKSTSSCFVCRGKHLLRATASTQTIQSFRSGEAEFVALFHSASICLGLVAMAADVGPTSSLIVTLVLRGEGTTSICNVAIFRALKASMRRTCSKAASREILSGADNLGNLFRTAAPIFPLCSFKRRMRLVSSRLKRNGMQNQTTAPVHLKSTITCLQRSKGTGWLGRHGEI